MAGADGGCLLIDPAVTVADLAALAGWLSERGLRPVAGWSTHPHWDHLLWSAAFGEVPRYATPRAVAVAARELPGLVSGVAESAPGHDLTLFARVEPLLGREIDWAGPRAVVYPHDAHAPGHGAVLLPDAGVLIAGDMLSDIEIPLLDLESADPFGDYRQRLELLAAVPGVRWWCPATATSATGPSSAVGSTPTAATWTRPRPARTSPTPGCRRNGSGPSTPGIASRRARRRERNGGPPRRNEGRDGPPGQLVYSSTNTGISRSVFVWYSAYGG